MPTRSEWRQTLRNARRSLTDAEQQHAARLLAQTLSTLPELQGVRRVAGYLANDGEISLAPYLAKLHKQNVCTSLPVLHPVSGNQLLFLNYHPTTPMVKNRFGIAEPALDCQAIRLPQEHQALLMPLVGFDDRGNRLGMGGGFYDRTLANLAGLPRPPMLIGVAHECQRADSLPVMEWDVPLDMIVTPHQVLRCR